MKPRLLDFCGAGGAAMGYHRAGFEVVPAYTEWIGGHLLDRLRRWAA
jgi:hypothetical protein